MEVGCPEVIDMRLSPEQRHQVVDAVRRGVNRYKIAEVFNVSRKTIWKWAKRAKHRGRESFKDKPRRSKARKITEEVELSILSLRTRFKWGTARIQQALIELPDYMKKVIPNLVQGLKLSRTAINNVLKKHNLNGYQKEYRRWKFFRAKKPDELWQLDLKGSYTVQGQKYWFLICIDDYSRYVVLCEQFDHKPTTKEITDLLESLNRKPGKILTDHGPQFKRKWEGWCKSKGIKPQFTHPYYPQDKGKVERTIRNVAEEFIYLLRKFPEWINGKIIKYKEWYNEKRFHRGINSYPIELYM